MLTGFFVIGNILSRGRVLVYQLLVQHDTILKAMYSHTLLLIPFSLSLAHYIGLKFDMKSKRNIQTLRSFAAGFSIGYVFLFLLPEVFRVRETAQLEVLYVMLLGFVFFHITHKYVYRIRGTFERVLFQDEIHLFTAALYFFLISFLLVETTVIDTAKGVLLTILLIVHTMLVDLSHTALTATHKVKFKLPLIITATVLGGLLPIIGLSNSTITTILFALTAGAIMYISIREEIPDDKQNNLPLFILGALMLTVANFFLL